MKKFLMIDTETTNDIECPLVYDVGLAIIDKKGRVYEKFSFVVADIFFNKELMQSAYFAEKIPQYFEDIKNGVREVRRFWTIKRIIYKLIVKYDIDVMIAHNSRFDYLSLNNTLRYLTKSKYRYFFPYRIKVYDTLKMSRAYFPKKKNYKKYCIENDFLTSRKQVRLTAEIIYRFITNDNSFEEKHTGLEDVLIEKDIFSYLFKRGYFEKGCLYSR